LYNNKSIQQNEWLLKNNDERKVLYISQKYNFSNFLANLISSININEQDLDEFIYPNLNNNLPNPFVLKDMDKSILRAIESIKRNEKIGILADYDVDGSTSAAILNNFFKFLNLEISIKVPNRLSEGYGPNSRIMDEFLSENVSIVYVLDCGTTSFDIFDNQKYSDIDIIIIDHHISDIKFPKVYSLINPNRYDEKNDLTDLSAVGVTFLFLMALRKKLRDFEFYTNKNEPNLLEFLDLVAIGTICDVVRLSKLNRIFVKKGLEIIKLRNSIAIKSILDKSKLISEPDASDIGYIIGPQINAASRLGESNLPSKLLTSKDTEEIDSISNKLLLLNEKRKLIENQIYEDAIKKININDKSKYIIVFNDNWHSGVLGIVASRLLYKYYKPTIIISFENNIGTGSARSIESINLGNIIMEAKNKGLLISGGGHKAAAGLKINKDKFELFKNYLDNIFSNIDDIFFKRKFTYSDKISLNQIQPELLEDLKILEPFGNGNEEPNFIFSDINIESIKIIKDKHILVFFRNDTGKKIKGICFNSFNTILGDYLLKYRNFKFEVSGLLKEDKYNNSFEPQIIIKDLMLLN
tara:strand:- start:5131 stop:6876 length:1746 start_codon:yes stop_codon:yes gene_type:complete